MRGVLVALSAVLAALLIAAAPVRAAAQPAPPVLAVTGADLYAPASAQQLYGVNADAEVPIASTTKLMTALVTLEHVHKLSTVFTQMDWDPASDDSQIGLSPGERMTVHDLLLAMMLPSADDAAMDLAYNVGGGSVARFVAMMNAEAAALGLRQTHYTNPIGLDQAGNYSSAYDLDQLAAYDMRVSPYFRRIVALPGATLYSGRYVRHITNLDTLIGQVPWITGVKTGHTSGAGYVLVSSGDFHGMSLVASVLGTDSEAARSANALALLEWGYRNYRLASPITAGSIIGRPTINGETTDHTKVIAADSFVRAVLKSDRVAVSDKLAADLTGPLPRHAVVGTATVTIGGHVAARVPLLLAAAIPGLSPLTQAARFVGRPITLVVLVVGLCAAGSVLATRRRRPSPAV